MRYQITQIIMIILMFVTQVGETFAFSSLPCANENMMMGGATMQAPMNGDYMDHSSHVMDRSVNASSTMNSEMGECCQSDCYCPMGVVSVTALINSGVGTFIAASPVKPVEIDANAHGVSLPIPQRPPKHSLS